mgnify:CR=1 FL=1
MIVLGITGGIGSGKSTVSKILSVLGVPVYIADDESKKLTDSSPIIREKLTALLGDDLYIDNKLNKAKLASIIFSDQKKLEQVNAIIHPEVQNHFLKWVENQRNKQHNIAACETAILFESGFDRFTDKSVTIYSPLEIRIDRITRRDNCTREKAQERINSQMPDEKKVELSDFIIVNNEDKSLIEQTIQLIEQLQQ